MFPTDLSNFDILVEDTSSNQMCGDTGSMLASQDYVSVTCSSPIPGQYVLVSGPGPRADTGLCDVTIMAKRRLISYSKSCFGRRPRPKQLASQKRRPLIGGILNINK